MALSPLLPSRRARRHIGLGLFLAFLLLLSFLHHDIWRAAPVLPPNYRAWHAAELALPQNDPDLPPPQGRGGRYVRFADPVQQLGWANVMQELVFNAHLAYSAGRIFTMYNYTYDRDSTKDYATFELGGKTHLRPSRVPLSAFLGGPIAGGSFPPPHDTHPPAVSDELFVSVCPNPARINASEFRAAIESTAVESIDAEGVDVLARAADLLRDVPDNCVEFAAGTGQVFDFWLFGDLAHMRVVYSTILRSPLLHPSSWAWSHLVHSAAAANSALLHPSLLIAPAENTLLKGLLALHVRRGDYEGHCKELARWNAKANAVNVLAAGSGGDALEPPCTSVDGVASPESAAFFDAHCFPDYAAIVSTVRRVLAEYDRRQGKVKAKAREIDRVYVLSNADEGWLVGLKDALAEIDPGGGGVGGGWTSIVTSRDLSLSPEQKYVAQAMDMMVAARAEVFIGNAWSSLTSNVNMLRVAHGHAPETIRFW